jgi:hypothetical protein
MLKCEKGWMINFKEIFGGLGISPQENGVKVNVKKM